VTKKEKTKKKFQTFIEKRPHGIIGTVYNKSRE
jgi:hypothetical protein